MEALQIVKLGGDIVSDQEKLTAAITSFQKIEGHKILIHGGGKQASEYSRQIGIQPKLINGRRITDLETLNVVVMVYAGLINKTIVGICHKNGINAIGLSGADGDLIRSTKRKVVDIDYGFAGDIEEINTPFLSSLLLMGYTPVICPITHDGKGQLLNTNADTIAATVSSSLSNRFTTRLWYCFGLPGVMKNLKNPDSLIEKINQSQLDELIRDKIIDQGMLPKLSNAFNSLAEGTYSVVICHVNQIARIPNQAKGTTICL